MLNFLALSRRVINLESIKSYEFDKDETTLYVTFLDDKKIFFDTPKDVKTFLRHQNDLIDAQTDKSYQAAMSK